MKRPLKSSLTGRPARKNLPRTSAPRAITPEDLQKFHMIGNQQISPDGRFILFTKRHVEEPNKPISNLWMVDVESGKSHQFTYGNKDAQGFWSPDGHKIAFLSGREKGKSQIYLINLDGGEARPLTRFSQGTISGFEWAPDGKSLAVLFREQDPEWTDDARKHREEKGLSEPARIIDDVWYRLDGDGYFNKQRFHLYHVDVQSGEQRKFFAKAPNGISSFSWAPDSKQLVIAANLAADAVKHPEKSRLYTIDVATGKHREVPGQKDGLVTRAIWSPDGRYIAFTGQLGKKDIWKPMNHHLFVLECKNGPVKDLTGGADLCLEAPILGDAREIEWNSPLTWSRDSRFVYFEARWQGSSNLARVDVRSGAIESCTKGDHLLVLGNMTDDGVQVALRFGNAVHLEEVAVGRWIQGNFKVQNLTHFNQELFSGLSLAAMESHWVRSSKGARVQVWVMKPPQFKPGKKYPAILEIHGGPHAQYGWSFFHEFQTLAARGYVVVFSNPRGSKGYGEEHCTAITGDWGNLDWQDIQSVTGFMKGLNYVDQKRLAVMGGSYGGYMTNWAIGHCDCFKVAITDRCVANLVSMAGSSDFPNVPDTYWAGNSWSSPETLWEQSPIRYFGAVKTPTLVIHSEGDLRCNIEQAEQVFATLKIRNVPTRLIRYPASTSHGLTRNGPADLRIHRLHQVLDWYNRYL